MMTPAPSPAAAGSSRLHRPLTMSPMPTYNVFVSELVYLLEDDGDISRLVCHHLEAAGYTVRCFASAANFVAEAQRQRPALCLLDIMVPAGNGLDVCKAIRRSDTIASTPIVFLTAKA